jgi:hypothetical protein
VGLDPKTGVLVFPCAATLVGECMHSWSLAKGSVSTLAAPDAPIIVLREISTMRIVLCRLSSLTGTAMRLAPGCALAAETKRGILRGAID